MPAYIICTRRGAVRDDHAFAEYQRRTRALARNPLLAPRVIYGAITPLEGTAPDGVIVLEFPTVDDASAWYHNPDYQAAIGFRQQAADYDMFIVEGLPT